MQVTSLQLFLSIYLTNRFIFRNLFFKLPLAASAVITRKVHQYRFDFAKERYRYRKGSARSKITKSYLYP